MKKYLFFLLSSILFFNCGPSKETVKDKVNPADTANEFSEELLSGDIIGGLPPSAKLRDITIDETEKKITLKFNRDFSAIPFRNENVAEMYRYLSEKIGDGYTFSVETINQPVENLIPNYFREKKDYDLSRIPAKIMINPVVDRYKFERFENGLDGNNIVLWHSHGWYYSQREGRWEWQRPRLFQTVEDLIPLSFTVPYLIPMLENAGANVFVPRERDFQTNEVVVDDSDKDYFEEAGTGESGYGSLGFGHTVLPLTTGVNPFNSGNTRYLKSGRTATANAKWIPDIPETGSYGVYISYASSENNISDAVYTVNYFGGSRDFIVNQTIGGGTWIYLGKFKFLKGRNPLNGNVTLISKSSEEGKIVSADAVRFGGGMGLVERGGSTSGRAKFFEGARYWLQYAGMPDTLVFNLNHDTLDYNDDYQSRGEYANYLKGAPYGPNRDRNLKGLGIPVDLSLAFHTDAGVSRSDTTIGTLAIYTLAGADSQQVFPDSVNRLACRDLSDIIQTQIVDDLREMYDPIWSRRQLREAQYSESYRPNMPAMLLELLSHQNFLDMQFVLDPRFKFDVSRAIYKGMLRFLSAQYGYDYVVQPLPVNYFSSELAGGNSVKLKWKARPDPLEPTASATRYVLYTRINDEDFNSGEIVYADSAVKEILPGKIYSFKVTAVNSGGESFPSEILAAGIPEISSKGDILIVNGFDRICGPALVNGGLFAGFLNDIDKGMPDKYDFGFTGRQYDYNIQSQWLTNDAPGHGASTAEYETSITAGNSFDYPYIHGKALIECGYSFASASDESFGEGGNFQNYRMIDYILGEEKETSWQKTAMDSIRGKQFKAFTPDVRESITGYLRGGGNLFITGSYLGSELYSDTITAAFAGEILKLKQITTHASKKGTVNSLPALSPQNYQFSFNTALNDSIYAVTTAGSINHTGEGEVLLRYAENQFSAGAGYRKEYGVAAFSFPFEVINGDKTRARIMGDILRYLGL